MNDNNFFNFLTSISPALVAKIFVLIALSIYVVFAFILVSQVSNMAKVLSSSLSPFLKSISWLLFLISIGVILAVLLFL